MKVKESVSFTSIYLIIENIVPVKFQQYTISVNYIVCTMKLDWKKKKGTLKGLDLISDMDTVTARYHFSSGQKLFKMSNTHFPTHVMIWHLPLLSCSRKRCHWKPNMSCKKEVYFFFFFFLSNKLSWKYWSYLYTNDAHDFFVFPKWPGMCFP